LADLCTPELQTTRLILRIPHADEAQKVVTYYENNRAHLQSTSPSYAMNFFAVAFWREQLRLNLDEFQKDASLKLFLFERENPDAIIGSVNFNNFVRRAGQYCALGYGLDRDKEGQGMMTEALRQAIDYLFTTLNMHRIIANYMPWNVRSGNVLRKLGFEEEGYARQFLFINGKWEDHIMTALINQSWDPRRA